MFCEFEIIRTQNWRTIIINKTSSKSYETKIKIVTNLWVAYLALFGLWKSSQVLLIDIGLILYSVLFIIFATSPRFNLCAIDKVRLGERPPA